MFMNWKSTGSPSQLEENGVLITSARSIAHVMNNFVIDMAPYMRVMKDKKCKLSLSHITVYKVRKLLSSLSNSRSTAMDDLGNFSVKLAAPVIATPLHHIITLSIIQQRFPSQWKYDKVLPYTRNLML